MEDGSYSHRIRVGPDTHRPVALRRFREWTAAYKPRENQPAGTLTWDS